MSAIAAAVHFPGRPADPVRADRLVAACARFAAAAGRADAGRATLTAALLRPGGRRGPSAPVTRDGRRWVVADARLDGRTALVAALRAAGRDARIAESDPELILHACAVWGDEAPHHLLGDFAFVHWDGERLLAARDPGGVRRLYHAGTPSGVVVASALGALAPLAGGTLDERWVLDFLLFGRSESPEATVYRAVREVPPGHLLVAEGDRVRVERYWDIPAGPPHAYRRIDEYRAHFDALWTEAVADRSDDGAVGVLLSGGVDSVAVAAEARALGRQARGYTVVYRRLFPCPEEHFAGLAADALGLPVTFLPADEVRLFDDYHRIAGLLAEPEDDALAAIDRGLRTRALADVPAVLTGMGGDVVMRESESRLARLLAAGRLVGALRETIDFARVHRRVPRPGLRTWLRGRRAAVAEAPPRWLAPALAARAADRLREVAERRPTTHPLRPEARRFWGGAGWNRTLARLDPAHSGIALEARHPLFDLRLVDFLFRVPPAMWYNDKALLRLRLRGRVPDAVARRPKTPLLRDPYRAVWSAHGDGWMRGRRLGPAADAFVDRRAVPRWAGGELRDAPFTDPYRSVRPLLLSLWLERHP